MNIHHPINLKIIFRYAFQNFIKCLCFREMSVFVSCCESNKTIRMNLDHVSICFVILFSSNIKFRINNNLLQNLSIFINNYDHIIEDKNKNWLHFIITDKFHMKLFNEVSLRSIYWSLFSSKLLLKLV